MQCRLRLKLSQLEIFGSVVKYVTSRSFLYRYQRFAAWLLQTSEITERRVIEAITVWYLVRGIKL